MNKTKEKILSISALIIIIDQIIKILVATKITINQEIEVIPNFFSLVYLKNNGAAFSILQDQKIILVIISLLVLFFIDRYISKVKKLNKISIISLGLIIGGIIGNLIDRLIQDGVIDYLSFQFGNYFFPVFNLADSVIIVGIILLIIGIIKDDKEKEEKIVKEKLSTQVEIIKNDKKKKTKKKS